MSQDTIALSGLSEDATAEFEKAFRSLGNNAWKLVDAAPATLLVVDIDTVWGHMDWMHAVHDNQRVVACTNDPDVRNCDLTLIKPIDKPGIERLLQAAGTAAPNGSENDSTTTARPEQTEATASAPEPAPAAATPSAAAATPAPDVEPPAPVADVTLGTALLTDKLDHAVSIGDGEITLQLDPEHGSYSGAAKLAPLRTLLDQPLASARPLTAASLDAMRAGETLPLTRLLWFAALCATPGKLAPELDPDALFHLTRWPQIEREFPRHFRIATAMMREANTIEALATTANTPETDVIDFINAYHMAGRIASTSAPTMDGNAAEPDKGVLSRLRRPFSRTSDS